MRPGIEVLPRLLRLHQPDQLAGAEAAALMRAAVGEREVFAGDMKQRNLAALHLHQLAAILGDVADRGDDVTAHAALLRPDIGVADDAAPALALAADEAGQIPRRAAQHPGAEPGKLLDGGRGPQPVVRRGT